MFEHQPGEKASMFRRRHIFFPGIYFLISFFLNMTDTSETDVLYSVQQTLTLSPDSSQRDLAEGAHMSLGMTNALLKRFVQKGWIMMKKVSPRTIRYVLTSDGMNALAERSRSYMSRTFRNIRECTESVERAVMESKQRGCTQVVLYGESDIAFIIEYACSKYGLKFSVERQVPDKVTSVPEMMLLISEQLDDESAENLRNAGARGVWEE